MNKCLVEQGEWQIWYRSHCHEYSCSGRGQVVDVERGNHRHKHWHTGRMFRKPWTVEQLVMRGMDYIDTVTDKEVAELEAVAELEERVKIILDVRREISA